MRARTLLPAAALLLALGCAVSHSPRGYKAAAELMQVDVRGSWISLELTRGPDARGRRQLPLGVGGELLAADEAALHLLVRDGEVVRVPWGRIRRGRLEAWESDAGRAAGQGWLLGLLSVGHGWWGVITLPLAILGSTAIVSDLSWKPILKLPKAGPEDLRPFARFPGGLPPGLDAGGLRLFAEPLPWRGALALQPTPQRWARRDRATTKASPPAPQRHLTRGIAAPVAAARGPAEEALDSLDDELAPLRVRGPAGLPGAWVRGDFRPGRPASLADQSWFRARRFAGLLLALERDTLFLLADSLRAVPRDDLHRARLVLEGSTPARLRRAGGIWNDGDLGPARLACFPDGLPDRGRAARVDSLRRAVRRGKEAAAWLDGQARWPGP